MKKHLFIVLIALGTPQSTLSVNFLRAFIDNFGTVEKGMVYRSGQLSPRHLAYYQRTFGFKTIINLRGANPEKAWWRNEALFCKKNGISLYNIPLSALAYPKQSEVAYLLSLFANAPRPILIHCQGGADRTGEACALWQFYRNRPLSQALNELSIRYRHFSSQKPLKKAFIRSWYQKKWSFFTPQASS
jgi:undecaprenyl-diphosphatase